MGKKSKLQRISENEHIESLNEKLRPSGINYAEFSPVATRIIKLTHNEIEALISQNTHFEARIRARFQSDAEFLQTHSSGTVRKGERVHMLTKGATSHERVAYEFGYEFQSLPSSRVNLGPVICEGDCKPITELGWHAERLLSHRFPGDETTVKYIIADPQDQERVEGIGILITRTTAPFIPAGHLVFAIVSTVTDHKFGSAVNPF